MSTSIGSSRRASCASSIDQDQARQLGLSSQDVALALNGVVSGSTVTQVRDSIYLIDVVARAEQAQRTSLELLRSLQIPLSNGRVVPLRQIATFEYNQEYPIVWRRNRVPTLTVQADVVPGVLPATAIQPAQPRYRPARGDAAERLSHRDRRLGGGERQGAGFGAGGPAGDGAGGADHPDLPVAELPARAVGAERGAARGHRRGGSLLLAQAPLGFVAILGVLALSGMIARNSVILIDQIEHERAAGTHPWDAVVTAAIHRTRPILLTASAATLGMIPIAPTVFWGPMAFAIIGGLAVATVLTLIFYLRFMSPGSGSRNLQPAARQSSRSRSGRCSS